MFKGMNLWTDLLHGSKLDLDYFITELLHTNIKTLTIQLSLITLCCIVSQALLDVRVCVCLCPVQQQSLNDLYIEPIHYNRPGV